MDEVLRKKGHTTTGSRGLQVWGDEATPDDGDPGTGGSGTAQRQARSVRHQKPHDE